MRPLFRQFAPPVLRTSWLKKQTCQRNRRERPVCRSAPERTELFPIIPENVPHCHSDGRVSGVEESTTLVKEPTQDKACHLGRFLNSLSLPRNDMSGGGSGQPHGLYSLRCLAMNHRRYIAYTVRRNGCSGGNLPPLAVRPLVVHLNLLRLNRKRMSFRP